MSERLRAFSILERVDREGAFAQMLIQRISADPRDVAFIRTIVFGVLRWRSRLDFILESLSRRKIRAIDSQVVQILRIGLYQLFEMDVPAYAAIDETVRIAAKVAPRARGFVNAVLRSATRTDLRAMSPEGTFAERIAVELAHPLWLVERWITTFGESRTKSILEANQQRSFPDLLVNARKIAPLDAAARLDEASIAWERSPFFSDVIRLSESTQRVSHEIEEGLFYPLDEGSVVVARIAGSGSGRILDLAAAPGGKSLVLALDGCEVISHDLSINRLRPAFRTFQHFFGRNPRAVAGDGTRPPFRGRFDTVLLDAPCSASGTIRKNPEVKWRLTPGCFDAFAARQAALLESALQLADRCVYATCSLEPEENDDVISRVLARHPEFRLDDISAGVPEPVRRWLDHGLVRLTPESGADGFTIAALSRRSIL